MRTLAGSFCKAGARYFCARPPGRFAKQWRAIFAHARWVLLQSRSALFCARPPGRFVKQGRAFCARRAAALPRLSAVRARPSTARSGPHSLPPVRPVRTPAFPSSWLRFLSLCTPSPPRAPTLLFVLPRPHAPALPSVFSVSPARPRHHPFFHPRRSAAFPFRAPGRCARLPLRRPSFPVPFYNSARLLCKKTLSAPPV